MSVLIFFFGGGGGRGQEGHEKDISCQKKRTYKNENIFVKCFSPNDKLIFVFFFILFFYIIFLCVVILYFVFSMVLLFYVLSFYV